MKQVKIKSSGGAYDTHKHILRDGTLDYSLAFCIDGIAIAGIDKANKDCWDAVPSWLYLQHKFPNSKVALNLDAQQNLDVVGWWIPLKDVEIENIDDFITDMRV